MDKKLQRGLMYLKNISMYKKISLFLCILTLLPSCFWKNGDTQEKKEKLFVQLIAQSQEVDKAMQLLSKQANAQIKEILDLPQDFDFDFYLPKELQRVSIYYFYDVVSRSKEKLLSMLDDLQLNKARVSAVTIKDDVRFFGSWRDELVVLLKEPRPQMSSNTLSEMHEIIATEARKLNQAYQYAHKEPLYNLSKSEKFDFLPHMGLGRLRVRHIVKHIKDKLQRDEILNQIRTVILSLARDIIHQLQGYFLAFDRIGVLDFSKRALSDTGYYQWGYVKEWKLKE